jgi:hypothetical protein
MNTAATTTVSILDSNRDLVLVHIKIALLYVDDYSISHYFPFVNTFLSKNNNLFLKNDIAVVICQPLDVNYSILKATAGE